MRWTVLNMDVLNGRGGRDGNDDGFVANEMEFNDLNLSDNFRNSTTPPKPLISLVGKFCESSHANRGLCGEKAVCCLYGKFRCYKHAIDVRRATIGNPCCAIVDIDTSGKFICCRSHTTTRHFDRYLCPMHFKVDCQSLSEFPEDIECAVCFNNEHPPSPMHSSSNTIEKQGGVDGTNETTNETTIDTTLKTNDIDRLENDGLSVCRLKCGHIFHKKCIMKWFEFSEGEDATCPICRQVTMVETGLVPFQMYKNKLPIRIIY